MPKIKKHLKDLYRTRPAEMRRKGWLRLDMNEGSHGLPPAFVKSVICDLDPEFLLTYPSHIELIDRIARHNGLSQKNICLGNGSDSVIKYIFETYISFGDKVLMTDPTFAMYPVYCKMFNAKPVVVSYRQDMTFPYEAFIEKLKKGVKMAVVVNPNNPTGDTLSPGALLSIIRKASEKDVLLVVDEAYFYYYPKTAIKLVNKYKNLIVLRTFSKLCAMANLRVGYAAAAPEIIENLNRVKPSFDVDGVAALFASKLLARPEIMRSMIRHTKKGSDYLCAMLKKEGIEHIAGNTNFILIKCGVAVSDIMRKLALRGIFVSGNFKQPFLKEYLRVTISNKVQMQFFWKDFIKIWKAI
jgi:histidinol-phosphate aminotransferase